MKTILLAASVAAIALSGGQALAATHKSAAVAGPKQPIPYAELSAYLKASPKHRATKDWWSGKALASTGAAANASATSTAGSDVRSTPDALPPTSATLPGDTPATGTVNPPAAPPPGAQPSTTPPK